MSRPPSPPSFTGHGPKGTLTEGDARALLDECEHLGMDLAPFARSKGLLPQRLSWWKQKFERAAATAARPKSRRADDAPAIIPVQIRQHSPLPSDRPSLDSRFELVLERGRVLRIPEHFAADALRRLLTALDGAR